jgi:hypothetical protein
MTEEIIVTTSEPEELRIESYMPHCWFRVPKNLRDHFDINRKGVFEISPPCFEHEEIEGKSLSFTFKWGCDLNNVDSPLNENNISEHVWVKSIRGLKYLHPSRAFNKILRHKYPTLWETQHFSHKWNDNGDVISLTISWDLKTYIKPEEKDD